MYSNKNDSIRNKSVLKLDTVIQDESISRYIERDIYNSIIQVSVEKNIKRSWDNIIFKNLYLNKLISFYSNLNPESYVQNKNLLARVKENKIDYKHIAKLHTSELFPEGWKELLNKKAKIDKLKYEKKTEAMTTLFKCRRCGGKECSYYEVQTRSADEPMTQFVTCLNPECNARWKQ